MRVNFLYGTVCIKYKILFLTDVFDLVGFVEHILAIFRVPVPDKRLGLYRKWGEDFRGK